MKHEDALEGAKAELKPLERLLAKPAEALAFERSAKPLIQCCFAFESGIPFEENDTQTRELSESSRQLWHWGGLPETIPLGKGRACVQLNRAARALHYRIRDVQTRGLTMFEGVATMVFLPLYREGSIIVDVHRISVGPGTMRLGDILEWLLAEYLLEFDGYDRSTFIDWIVGNVHLSPAELGGADALEDWYRKRAGDISFDGIEEGSGDDS